MTAPKLLPCPFCGGEATLIEGDECAYVQCLQVKNHRGPFVDGDNAAADEAISAWNTRTDLAQADYDARIRSAITITSGDAEITRLRAVIAKDAAQMIEDQHKMHKAVEALREVIDFACALNNVAAGQNPEQLDRWSAALSALAAKVDASQAPNPAANGGRCQSDPITLPRAEVEALMDLLRRAKHCIGDNYLHWQGESDVALATLQERMK